MKVKCDSCNHFEKLRKEEPCDICWMADKWEPRKEPKQDKTVSRKEMVVALMEEPKRRGKLVKDVHGEPVDCKHLVRIHYDKFIFEDGETVTLDMPDDKSRWTIIEPQKELKKMSFGEAMKYYIKNKKISPVDSYITYHLKNAADTSICDTTPDEIDGLWTCEGILEEVKTNG